MLKINHPPKHLLVDLDGTLLGNHALPVSIKFISQSLKNLRAYTGWKKAAQILLEIQKELARVSDHVTLDDRVIDLFAARTGLGKDESRKILRESLFVIFPTLEKHFYPMPGAREFLDWAKNHYTLTLATNPVWPVEVIEMRVKWAGLDPKLFREITHIRTMKAAKPQAQYYQELLKLQKLEAADCLLIGNDLKMDLPATRVGISTFIVDKSQKKLTALKPLGSKTQPLKAYAWRGSFKHLRSMLEACQ